MMQFPFEQARPILEKIEASRHQAFLVGGCVRDMLLNRTIGDIDITTSASPQTIQRIFDKVIPIGIEHGTVIVRYKQISYEVTTFRLDGTYSDQRHPDDVTFVQTVDEDLKRRDFTINALAMDMHGEIVDLFNGKQDLKNGIIRTVGDGYCRFHEDPLRIIRALRFSSQLGFTIEKHTLNNIEMVKDKLAGVAVERMTVELSKFFAGEYIHNGLHYLKSTKLYQQLPVIKDYPSIIERLPEKFKPLQSFGEVIALFHYLEPRASIQLWAKSWKCSNKIKKEAFQLFYALQYLQTNGLDNWLVYRLDPAFYTGFIRLCQNLDGNSEVKLAALQEIANKLPISNKRELAINGNELIKLFPGTKKGPWIQSYLNTLEKQVVMSAMDNNKNILKDWIKWNPPEIN